MKFKRIVLLAGSWDTTPVVFNFLQEHLSVDKAIIEEPVSRKTFLKKRIKKLGWITVGGQVLFQMLIGKPLARKSRKRIQDILAAYRLSERAIPREQIQHVSSVNSEESIKYLNELQPDLVVVHGTRIISKKVLNSTNAVFVNIHAGITPRYRGSHGAYWALANNDQEHCGVTVHLVDPGIDTGGILGQAVIPITGKDNFSTYPYLQLAEGLKVLAEAVKVLENGNIKHINNNLDSALWHHPTLWFYIWKRITRSIK